MYVGRTQAQLLSERGTLFRNLVYVSSLFTKELGAVIRGLDGLAWCTTGEGFSGELSIWIGLYSEPELNQIPGRSVCDEGNDGQLGWR